MRTILLLVALVTGSESLLRAEITRDGAARLGVDVVQVQEGREARGCIVERREGAGLTIAVRRAWLQQKHPDWIAELDAASAAGRRATLETLVTRIRKWRETLDADKPLTAIVGRELEDFERQTADGALPPADQPESEFVLIDVPEEQIRRVYAQPPERKQAGLVAWREHIDNVEATPVDRLQKSLESRKIDWRTMKVDLSDRLPPTAADGEREWAARTALYEFAFGRKVEFQGTGDFIVRTGDTEEAPAGMALLGGLLQGEIGADLSGLLSGALGKKGAADAAPRTTWLETATRTATAADARGFRVTRTQQDVVSKSVTVESRFVALLPDGAWETVFQASETLDASQERADLEARIRQDEHVVETLKLVEGLGLGNQMQTAIRFGAATMAAQQSVDTRFFEFRDRYTQRLDGPVLKWDAAQD